MTNRYSRPIVAWRRQRAGVPDTLSRCHLETEAGSGELVCGYWVPDDVDEVLRGAEAIDELDPFVDDCLNCAEISRLPELLAEAVV